MSLAKRFILLSIIIIFSSLSRSAFAYEIDTHTYLTDEIINFYNKSFPNNLMPAKFRDYLLDGSRREDDNLRSMNHFYDPVNDIGLNTPILKTWEKSKDWAGDSSNQDDLKYKVPAAIASILSAIESGKISDISAESDFTWEKGIDLYASGEREKAFFILGHILHLMEDTSVPDHTRNDPHVGDSPYENWTQQFTVQNKDAGLLTRLVGKNPIQLADLNSYFDGLANYSNNNFYSKDTIGLGDYKSPEPDYMGNIGKYCYAFKNDTEDGDYPLLVYDRCADSLLFSNTNNASLKTAGENEVLSGYWSRLSTKAVQYGAGVINLFLNEAEAAKNDPNFNKQSEQKSFLASIASGAQSVISAVGGAIQKAASALQDILKQNNSQPEESPIIVPKEIPTNEIVENVPDEIDSDLVTAEQVTEDVELLPANQEITLTEADKAAITQMLARLDDLMRQAIELKSRMEAVNAPKDRSSETKVAIIPSGGGGEISRSSQGIVQDTSVDVTPISDSSNNEIVNSTSTATTIWEVPAIQNAIDHILISEILFNASGTDVGKEFIELYNPTEQSFDLTGWSLREFVGDSTSSNSLAVFKSHSHPEDKTIVASKGFLLIGLNNFDENVYAKRSDIVRSVSLPNGGSSGEPENIKIILDDGADGLIDGLTYNALSIPGAGYSLERKTSAGSTNCVIAQGTNEFYGHNCDTGNASDFDARPSPNPQNSESLPEPRQAPILSDAAMDYSPSSVSLNFKWDESSDAMGATSTVIYEIRDAVFGDILATTTGVTSFQKGIDEVGRNYSLAIQAIDRDGLGSAITPINVFVPSFLDKFYFYNDPRSPGQNVADAYYSKYPFIPGGTNTWKLVLLYLNADAEKDVHLIEENGFRPVDNSHFLSISRFTDLAVPEDFHFISSVTLPNGLELSTSTYITAAFYDWEMRYGAYAGFHLVAVDKQRYYFQDSAPSSAAPSPPSDISFSFDDFHSALGVNWPQAMDPDTADTALSYEFNYSTSTEFRPDKWQNVGRNTNSGMNVVLGNDYLVGVRAKDDFGNISDPIIRSWNDFPAGYQLLPFQPGGDHPIGTLDGNGQKILISQDSQITRASLWMSGGGGQYSIGASYLAVASDDNGAIGSIIATSSSVTSQYGIQNEVIYNFSAPVYLASGNYWLVPVYAGWGGNTVYGTNDAYPDGYWSGNPSADAYFFIR